MVHDWEERDVIGIRLQFIVTGLHEILHYETNKTIKPELCSKTLNQTTKTRNQL